MAAHLVFKVSLLHAIQPPWRRFSLPATASFLDLHEALQDACGWEHSHLFDFLEGGKSWNRLPAEELDEEVFDWRTLKLRAWFGDTPDRHDTCVYVYDFGDDWNHHVEYEGVVERPVGTGRQLLDGARAFPPEDCGGMPGFLRCAQLARGEVAAKNLDDHDRDLLPWLGDWHPETFDLEQVQAAFEGSGKRRRSSGAAAPIECTASELFERTQAGKRVGALSASMARILALAVNAYSLLEAGPPRQLALRCNRRPNQSVCEGHILISPWGPETAMEWCCTDCGVSGFVYDWDASSLDMRKHLELPEPDDELFEHELPADLYPALHAPANIAVGPTRSSLLAQPMGDRVVLEFTELELEELLSNLSMELDFEHHSKAHLERLEQLIDALDPPPLLDVEQALLGIIADFGSPIDE